MLSDNSRGDVAVTDTRVDSIDNLFVPADDNVLQHSETQPQHVGVPPQSAGIEATAVDHLTQAVSLPTLSADTHDAAHLVFVDPSVSDLESVYSSVKGSDVVLLDPSRDTLSQIHETISGHNNISAVHLVTDGSQTDSSSDSSVDGQSDALLGSPTLSNLGNLSVSSWYSPEGNLGTTLSTQGIVDVHATSTPVGSNWVVESFNEKEADANTEAMGGSHAQATGGTHTGHPDGGSSSVTLLYPSYQAYTPTPPVGKYGSGNNELGISYGTLSGNVVDDIYTGTYSKYHDNSSSPGDFIQFDGQIVFSATTSAGRELWISNGTVAGTTMLDDIGTGSPLPGVTSSDPMIVVGNELYFGATTSANGFELWETDGTTGGTQLLDDIDSGSASSDPHSLVDLNNTLFFIANDGTHGPQVWTSGGTTATTQAVTTFTTTHTGAYAPSVYDLVASGSYLYFVQNPENTGVKSSFYVSDGTAGGTHLLDSGLDITQLPQNMTNVDGTLYFTMGTNSDAPQLWTSNGTAATTQQISNVSGADGLGASEFVMANSGEVYFLGSDTTHGGQLWETNGTEGGTQMVDLINPAGTALFSGNLVTIGNEVYFAATDVNAGTQTLWESNGTTTQQVDSAVTANDPVDLTNVNGTLYFVARGSDDNNTYDIFKLSGSTIVEVASNFSGHENGQTEGGDIGIFTFLPGPGIAASPVTPTVLAAATATGTGGTSGTGVLGSAVDSDGYNMSVTAVNGSAADVGTQISGTYGELTLNADGSYSYSANNSSAISAQPDSAVLTDAFTFTITDIDGYTTTQSLTFTVDQAPTVTSVGAVAAASANLSASHTVTVTIDTGKDVTVAAGTTLQLSDGSTVTYASGSGTQALTFTGSVSGVPGASITISSVTAGSLADAAGNALVVAGQSVSPYTLTVTDTAADVSANFNSLNTNVANITSITLTDGGTPSLDLTASQTVNDTTLIALIQATNTFNIVVNDSAADVSANFNALNSDVANISSITLSDGGTPALDLTVSQAFNDTALLGKISSPYNLVIDDSEANVSSNLASLNSDASNIFAVKFNNGGTPLLTVTAAQASSDAAIIAKIEGPYDLLVTGVTGQAYSSYEEEFNASSVHAVTIFHDNSGADSIYGYVSGLSFTGTPNNTIFALQSAPSVSLSNLGSNSSIYLGADFSAGEKIAGGSGTNAVTLDGNYTGSHAVTMSATTLTNIQTLTLDAGFSYNLTTNAATVVSAQTMTVNGGALGSSDDLTWNSSAQTAGTLIIDTGNGTDSITLGGGTNTVHAGTGTYTIHGGAGSDLIAFTTGFTAADKITGGTSATNTVSLDGNYTGGNAVTFGASTMTGVQELVLDSGFSYNLTINAATVGSGQSLEVDGLALAAGNNLTFNAAAETTGSLLVYTGNGTDSITLGGGSSVVHAGLGVDTIAGGSGSEQVFFTTGFAASDTITGGTGSSLVVLDGNYTGGSAVTMGATTMTNIQDLVLDAGFSYNLTTNAATVASGHTFEVNASRLGASNTLTFNGSADAGHLDVFCGAGTNVVTGGNASDTFNAGTGTDTFVYTSAAQSTSTTYDTIAGMNFGTGHFELGFTVGAVQTAITTGTLSTSTFNANLTSALTGLGAHHAVLFTPNAGTLAGQTFLIIDANGTAGYQAGGDIVIHLTGETGTLSTSDFIT